MTSCVLQIARFAETSHTDAFVVVYSVEDRSSYVTAVERLDEIRREENRQVAVILVANKSDLVRSRVVMEVGQWRHRSILAFSRGMSGPRGQRACGVLPISLYETVAQIIKSLTVYWRKLERMRREKHLKSQILSAYSYIMLMLYFPLWSKN